MLDNIQEIEIADLRRLTQLVQEKYNFDFKNYAMSSFKRRIQRIVELYKFKTVGALIDKLSSQPAFFEEFLSEVTVNVTEMFRDPVFWALMRDEILPGLISNHERISIWHAGCSSGEEVISMAIILEELNALDKANIIATDIDTAIIDKARKGRINKKNMELHTKNYETFGGRNRLQTYFKEEQDSFVIDSSLLRNVSYRKHNLVSGSVFSRFDIILCRNVMIYFNQTLQNDVLNTLHQSLFNYGYLAIGSKESLIWCDIANKFMVINNEEKVYKKIKE